MKIFLLLIAICGATSRSTPNHLVLVVGHAIVDFMQIASAATDEGSWYLLGYQKGKGLPQVIGSHIHGGIVLATNSSEASLMFSGGQTRPEAGPGVSEASSYFAVARQEGWLPSNMVVTLEEYALDSFQNILFSLCRFFEVWGVYPTKLTVVGFPFKRERFRKHIAALRFPEESFAYVGVEPPALFDQVAANRGEAEARLAFESDPYGCHSPELRNKRQERNPYNRTAAYPHTCPAMTRLLQWCGPELYEDAAALPWNNISPDEREIGVMYDLSHST